jgi:hypothetical protein
MRSPDHRNDESLCHPDQLRGFSQQNSFRNFNNSTQKLGVGVFIELKIRFIDLFSILTEMMRHLISGTRDALPRKYVDCVALVLDST